MAFLAGCLAALIGLTVMLLGTIFPNIGFSNGYAFDYSPYKDVAMAVAYFITTFLGIFSSMIYRRLEGVSATEQDFNFSHVIKKQDFIRSIIVSPLVFVFVLNSFGKDANILMSFIFAYQNGFFWEIIVKKLGSERNGASHDLVEGQ